jgi:hemerythrin-like domain-containing protein
MLYTELYRHQHTEIVRVATTLEKQLVPKQLAENSFETWKTLSDLGGKITVHLAAEDRWLYKQLQSSSDPSVRDTATRFAEEMGHIAQAFKTYEVRWTAVNAIKYEPDKFVAETHGILKVLADRIRREHHDLYPLAEKLETRI